MIPTLQQEAIFEWFRSGKGNLVVRARPGTGKTTTIVEAIRHASERSILLCAFNREIAEELQKRVADVNVECLTLHQVGLRLIPNRPRVAEHQRANAITNAVASDQPANVKYLITKLHSKARELAPLADRPEELLGIAQQFDCMPGRGMSLELLLTKACEAMKWAAEHETAIVDFADMIFLPIRQGLLYPKFDLVVIDEAQDLSAPQLFIAQQIARGRIVAVGDDRQAIYGFRGADSTALDRLKLGLSAQELNLTVSFRCGKRIAESVQELVSDFEASENNPEGSVEVVPSTSLAQEAQPGCYILSRKNAPLVGVAFALIKRGKRVKVLGKDIGDGLEERVKKLAKGDPSISNFLQVLRRWEDAATSRILASGGEHAAVNLEEITNTAEILRILANECSVAEETDDVLGIIELIRELFSDEPGQEVVICSSIHKIKGKEADTVFVLRDTLYPKLPCICGHWHRKGVCWDCRCEVHTVRESRRLEEENLDVVARSRAKHRLVWVEGLRF